MNHRFTKLILLSSLTLASLVSVPSAHLADSETSQPAILTGVESREISGQFNLTFQRPWQQIRVNAGTVEQRINGIMLSVRNGGPQSLSWSVMVVNNRTGQQVLADWAEFKHGTNALRLLFDRNAQVNIGDSLSLVFTNNNFPSNSGPLTIYGSLFQF